MKKPPGASLSFRISAKPVLACEQRAVAAGGRRESAFMASLRSKRREAVASGVSRSAASKSNIIMIECPKALHGVPPLGHSASELEILRQGFLRTLQVRHRCKQT